MISNVNLVCSKVFSDAGDLKKHIHTIHESHKVQNDFKCESCGKSFSQAGDLKKHIHTIHESHTIVQMETDIEGLKKNGRIKTNN